MTYRSIVNIVIALCFLSCFAAAPARAQITETQHLNFGEWLITSNASTYNITVNADTSYTHSPQMVMLAPPQPGEYQVQGLPSFAHIVSVSVIMSQPINGPGGQVFTMDNFDVIAPDADFNGDTTITLGARAVTSGSSVNYTNGVYTGELTLQINL